MAVANNELLLVSWQLPLQENLLNEPPGKQRDQMDGMTFDRYGNRCSSTTSIKPYEICTGPYIYKGKTHLTNYICSLQQ